MRSLRTYAPLLALPAVAVGLHGVLAAEGDIARMTQLIMSAYYALVVIGLCLLMGYAGQASLGHAGFFALGGYVSAAMTTCNLLPWRQTTAVRLCEIAGLLIERKDPFGMPLLSFAPWAAFATAMLVCGAVAFVIGVPVIRLRGHYLAMATLGFGLIVYRIVLAAAVFGQADGISNVPPFELLPGLRIGGSRAWRVENYYIAWGAVMAAMLLAINLINSRVGLALRSIHESEEAAHSLGVDTYRYKLAVFVFSALLAGAGGVLLTHYNGSISPSEASVMKSVRYVAIVAAGGMANLWGALGMGMVLNYLSLRGQFGRYDEAVFGLILIAMMLFAPQGLLRPVDWSVVRRLLAGRARNG